MTLFQRTPVAVMAAAMLVLAGCNGDTPKTGDTAADSAAAHAAALFKTRRALADSVMNAAPTMPAVVKKMGKGYDEADAELTAAVLRESAKTRDCYTKALADVDPNLTVVLYMLVNFGAAGWDLVRVENWTMSSTMGGAVITCINNRAKAEWNLPTKGVKPGAHLVKLVYTPDSAKSK